MITDYEVLFSDVEANLAKIGFYLKEKEDYISVFSNGRGWEVVFEGDRHVKSAYTLWIGLENRCPQDRYALWLLIKTFEKIENLDESVYTLEQELNWLVVSSHKIFLDPAPYANVYKKLDSIEL